jgi:hypothetical protein
MKYSQIPKMTQDGTYSVNVSWTHLEAQLADYNESATGGHGCNLDPEFQRAHVWTEEKQRRYVEFALRGGKSSRTIYFNHPNWMSCGKGTMVLVDGKQRLEAVRKYMRDELRVFKSLDPKGAGYLRSDFTDKLDMLLAQFIFVVNNLKTHAEVLTWYIDLNDGGVAHTSEEIGKVRAMLAAETKTKKK